MVILFLSLVSTAYAQSQDLNEIKRVGIQDSILLSLKQNNAILDVYEIYIRDLYSSMSREERVEVVQNLVDFSVGTEASIDRTYLDVLNYVFLNEPDEDLKSKLILPLSTLDDEASFMTFATVLRQGSGNLNRKIAPVFLDPDDTSEEIFANSQKQSYCLFKGDIYDIRSPVVDGDKITFRLKRNSNIRYLDLYTYGKAGALERTSRESLESDGLEFISIRRRFTDIRKGFVLAYLEQGSGDTEFYIGSGGRKFNSLEDAIPIPFVGPTICPVDTGRQSRLSLLIKSNPVLSKVFPINIIEQISKAPRIIVPKLTSDFSQFVEFVIGDDKCLFCNLKKDPVDPLVLFVSDNPDPSGIYTSDAAQSVTYIDIREANDPQDGGGN